MTKTLFGVILLVSLAVSPHNGFATNWGVEFTGMSWEMDAEDFKTSGDSVLNYARSSGNSASYRLSQGRLGGQAAFFLEGKSALRFGASLGYGIMPAVSYWDNFDNSPVDNGATDWENKTAYIPLDAYIKFRSEKSKIGFFAGVGADYIMAITEMRFFDSISGDRASGTFRQKKLVPHLQAGSELFLNDTLSVSLGIKYLFSAVLDNLRGNVVANGASMGEFQMMMDDDGHGYWIDLGGSKPFKYDYSGLRTNLGGYLGKLCKTGAYPLS
jgi:hypothetical protein